LERDLEDAHKRIIDLRSEKASLEGSVKELQGRLTSEQRKNGANMSSAGAGTMSAALLSAAQGRGEREKELQNLLVKVKADKDKAVKVIINLVGKERMASFLSQHAGSADILDAMIAHFGADTLQGGANEEQEANLSPSKARSK
jgi:hypothetical protein